jgi:hypothetical protein
VLNIEKGKSVHCVETVTGQNLTGTLLLSEDRICVDLYSYTHNFHIDDDRPIYLVAQTGQIVSLHANVDNGTGTTSHRGRKTYHQGFISNVDIVGHDQWTDADKVKKVSFTVEHSMALLRHRDRIQALGTIKDPTKADLTIFEVIAEGMKLGAGYGATYNLDFDPPKELWPIFWIEFNEPQSIHDYIEHVTNYVAFLAFCFGSKLKPDRISIDRFPHDEMMVAVEAGTYLGNHEVHYVWPEEKIDLRDVWVGGSPVCAWDEDELSSLRACLVAWISRANVWNKPYGMMVTSFALKGTMSAERIINACRWLENVPIAQSNNAISKKDVKAIAAAATQKAEELGHDPHIRRRIANAIQWVKAESAEERFTRLVAKIEEKFGKDVLPENVVAHLRRAVQFRARAAHGHFNPESEEEFSSFAKSTRAMEAFCYLLTALDLPISVKGLERARSNPVVRDYRFSQG